MVSKRKTRRKRGGSEGDKTTHAQGHKSSPLAPIGGMIRMMSDTVGGLIKGTGDGIASAMGSSEPKGGDKTSSSDVPDIDTPKVPDVSKTSEELFFKLKLDDEKTLGIIIKITKGLVIPPVK